MWARAGAAGNTREWSKQLHIHTEKNISDLALNVLVGFGSPGIRTDVPNDSEEIEMTKMTS
jgi:hypothetical protein